MPRGPQFGEDEEIQLCMSYLKISEDPRTGTDQTAATFWKRIQEHFTAARPAGSVTREMRSLECKWSKISSQCKMFASAKDKVERRSGASFEDEIHDAQQIYMRMEDRDGVTPTKPFKLLHCWRILRNEPLWTSTRQGEDAPAEGAAPDPDDRASGGRPQGRKAAKQEAKTNAATTHSIADLAKANKEIAIASKKRARAIQDASDIALFTVALGDLDPDSRRFFELRRLQDAALLCLLWYLFGRASDLAMVHKRNISVDASNVLFLRLVRVKTSEEQGLSIFPDVDFATCLVLAIALALVSQAAPCPELVGNLPAQAAPTAATLSPEIPLIALLNMPLALSLLLHPHVQTPGVEASLTSHSFRRGGAQHANGCDEMTARWIFDRGSWNMSTTNKGFNYIFNTSKEDHKIAKVLSGYKPKDAVSLQDLPSFDAQTLESIVEVQRVLLSSCYNLAAERYNVNKKVLDVLTACVVRHFPLLKALNPGRPVVKRVEVAISISHASDSSSHDGSNGDRLSESAFDPDTTREELHRFTTRMFRRVGELTAELAARTLPTEFGFPSIENKERLANLRVYIQKQGHAIDFMQQSIDRLLSDRDHLQASIDLDAQLPTDSDLTLP
ncbi:hypothetical protein PHMEG_0006171 [Phytophthora megakarya]|uniref:No apical meristem-associated C-terminal domain-containing protein n=1 Tax=Phytophthora megakarya TaxID=4795 RepID=A0A225WPJ6_9STRA|nr:hypothetical protein PHMEG_0006171 [Phytophthora megakarya]